MRARRKVVRNKVQQAYLVAAVFSVASGASLKTSNAKMPKTNAVFILTLVPSFLSCWKHTYVVESLLCSPPTFFSSKKKKLDDKARPKLMIMTGQKRQNIHLANQ